MPGAIYSTTPKWFENPLIPAKLGRVLEVVNVPRETQETQLQNPKTLIHIEEAHAHRQGAENTQEILELLKKEKAFDILFLEGAWSKLRHKLPEPIDQTEAVVADLLEKGFLGGPELFLLENDKA